MKQEKRFSVERGIEGCLASLICMMVLMLPVSLVLNEWLKLISNESERIIGLFIWLFAICAGGYFAARQSRTTGWTNSLVVGLLAEFFVAASLPQGGPDKGYLAPFLEMVHDPSAHWQSLIALALSIPVAIVGGVIWQKTGAQEYDSASPSDPLGSSGRHDV